MTNPSDISRLFKHIGVSDATYQEIGKQNGARESQSRWPLLDSLHAQANRTPEVNIRRRFDIDSASLEQAPQAAAPESELFPHRVTGHGAAMDHPVHTTHASTHPDDLRASDAAMAAVQAAPAPAVEPEPSAPLKVAEFIAPRPKGLARITVPPLARAPYVPQDEPHAAPAAQAPVEQTPAHQPAPAPAYRGPLSSSPLASALASVSDVVPAASMPAASHAPSAASALPAATQSPAPVVRSGSLFDRLANPDGAPADEAVKPTTQSAPLSLFERLIRS